MDTYKLKIKIGDHEFDAEGPVEAVQSQFQAFKELIAALPSKHATKLPQPDVAEQSQSLNNGGLALDKIMHVDRRVVSLTVAAESTDDAVMLILLGQTCIRKNDRITGGEVMDGLKMSGHVVHRVDKMLDRFASDGQVIKIGSGRGMRYKLTQKGMAKAQELAKAAIGKTI